MPARQVRLHSGTRAAFRFGIRVSLRHSTGTASRLAQQGNYIINRNHSNEPPIFINHRERQQIIFVEHLSDAVLSLLCVDRQQRVGREIFERRISVSE